MNRKDPRGLYDCVEDEEGDCARDGRSQSGYTPDPCFDVSSSGGCYGDSGDGSSGGGDGSGGGGDDEMAVQVKAAGTYTQSQYQALLNGFKDALERVSSKPDCAGFFVASTFDHDLSAASNALEDTTYRIISLPSAGFGAATMGPGDVFINSNGSFFITGNGSIVATMPDSQGKATQILFGSTTAFEGFILLHELGHEMGVFGKDAGYPGADAVNGSNSKSILDNCFNQDAKGAWI